MEVFKPVAGNTFSVPGKGDYTLKLVRCSNRVWQIFTEQDGTLNKRLADEPWIVRIHALPHLDDLVKQVVESNTEVLNYLRKHGV